MNYKKLNLSEPKTFNEKLQWLKLYDRKSIYCKMVDKYEAKSYVANIIGQNHIVKNLGIWNNFDDIDFSLLPNQFVLKCTHDSGGIVICKDKSKFDISEARNKLSSRLKKKYFYTSREWPYKNIVPRIIAEEYLTDSNCESGLIDYKFFFFNGDPQFLYVSKGLDNHATANMSFLTLDWTFAKYSRKDYPQFKSLPNKPANFNRMIEFAKELSKETYFLRVDFYEINGNVLFSELTFFPNSGFVPFANDDFDRELGSMLKLPK